MAIEIPPQSAILFEISLAFFKEMSAIAIFTLHSEKAWANSLPIIPPPKYLIF